MKQIVDVIIPALNEEKSISLVISDLPKEFIRNVIVVDNGSTDETAQVASDAGAVVLKQAMKGYGYACLTGIDYCKMQDSKPDVILFIDGDYSDFPQEANLILDPIFNNTHDFVVGSRALGKNEKGSMTIPQRFGNWLSSKLILLIYKVKFTDLGPFRAIRFEELVKMDMQDKTYGWTVEMQIKAAKMKLRCIEVPVTYRKRIGKSKVSGTVKGSFLAGHKILWTIFKSI